MFFLVEVSYKQATFMPRDLFFEHGTYDRIIIFLFHLNPSIQNTVFRKAIQVSTNDPCVYLICLLRNELGFYG